MKRATNKGWFLVARSGDGAFRFWSNQRGAMGGWRPCHHEASVMAPEEALEVMGRLGLRVIGFLVGQTGLTEEGLKSQVANNWQEPVGFQPDPGMEPAESACSGSFCEISAFHQKEATDG